MWDEKRYVAHRSNGIGSVIIVKLMVGQMRLRARLASVVLGGQPKSPPHLRGSCDPVLFCRDTHPHKIEVVVVIFD